MDPGNWFNFVPRVTGIGLLGWVLDFLWGLIHPLPQLCNMIVKSCPLISAKLIRWLGHAEDQQWELSGKLSGNGILLALNVAYCLHGFNFDSFLPPMSLVLASCAWYWSSEEAKWSITTASQHYQRRSCLLISTKLIWDSALFNESS